MDITLKELFERYGGALALAAAIVLVTLLTPAIDKRDGGEGVRTTGPVDEAAQPLGAAGTTSSGSSDAVREPTVSGSESASPGSVDSAGAGAPAGASQPAATDGPCRPDGRTEGISIYQPPCVPLFRGDNGGATARGVTPDEIKVVLFQPQASAAQQAALSAAGLAATDEEIEQMAEGFRRYYNNHHETYGREVVVEIYKARGANTDDQAMRADALAIADTVKAFAVMTLVASDAFIEELTARGVIVLDAALNRTNAFYERTAPYFFSRMSSAEEIFAHVGEYIGKRLAGKAAEWAGTTLAGTPRAFGLVYLDQPGFDSSVEFLRSELARHGANLERAVGYSSDTARAQEQASNIIAQMKSSGVTTVIFNGDLLYPIFLTEEADRQLYEPEWFTTGSGLEDITFIGRKYSQNQWRHAFGISPMYMYWVNLSTSEGYREWHHGMPEADPGDEYFGLNTPMNMFRLLFLGIHLAGPNLTPDSYVDAMYRYPVTGGEPHFPAWSFTPESRSAVEDRKQVWWNPTATCRDEFDSDGVGCMMHVDNGVRTRLGAWPTSTPKMFDPDGAIVAADVDARFPHEADGHDHDTRCRSCGS